MKSSIIVALFLAMFFLFMPAFSQGWLISNSGINTSESLNEISAPASNGIYISSTGGIYKSANGGDSYTKVNTNTDMDKVLALDANTAWGLANFSISKTTNGGSSWVTQSIDSWPDKNGICNADANILWAVAWDGAIWKTTNGGITWTTSRSYTGTEHFYGCAALNSSVVYACGATAGTDAPVIFKTTNGGSSWTKVFQGSNGGSGLYRILIVDANTIYAVGTPGIYRTTDGGANWTNVYTAGLINGIARHSSGRIYVVGLNGKILYSDNGSNWVAESSGTSKNLNSIAINGNTGWIVGNNGIILRNTLLIANNPSSDILLITKGTVGSSDNDLYTIDTNATNEKLVFNDAGDIRQARWSADNSKITFSSNASSTGKYEVFTINSDGSNIKQITATSPTYGNGHSLFRSDSKIWYANAQTTGVTEIFEINWDGSGSKKLTNFQSEGRSIGPFDIDTKNNKIYYNKQDASWAPSGRIYSANLDFTNEQRLTAANNYENYPRVSPDGKKVVFQFNDVGDAVNLYIINADGSGKIKLTNVTGSQQCVIPVWSSDGLFIYYSFNNGSQSDIYKIGIDGQNGQKLTNTANVNEYVWECKGTSVTTNYTLSLTKAGTGSGEVKVNGTLQNLPYSGAFSSGASVNLEAVPASGSMFSGWSGDLSGSTNPTYIAMSGNKNVTVNFLLVVPQPPVLSSPASGSLGVGTSPTLSWNASSGATSYRIQVSTNSGFTSLVVDQSGIGGTSYTASGLNNGTTYYWRVNATNAEGTSGWSSTWNFTTGTPPSAPPISLEGPDKAAAGTEFTLDVQVGSAARPVSNLKIVSFELTYTNTAKLDYSSYETGSFITGAAAQVMADDAAGRISASVYRMSGGNSGYGVVLRLKFQVAREAPEGMQFDFGFARVLANAADGSEIVFGPMAKTLTVESGLMVWPGDADNSGAVNIFDINPIVARYWGRTGPQRQNASMTWTGQRCIPWNPPEATYTDGNGDGVVSIFDINAVVVNFSKTHTSAKPVEAEAVVHEPFVTGTPLVLTADKTQVKPGEEFWVSTVVGTAENPVSRLKIISLEMTYDMTSYVDYVSYELGDFLTGASGQVIAEDAVGKVSSSVYRTSGSNNGYGQVVRFKFKMAANVPSNQQVRFDVCQFMANDEDGNLIAITPSSLTINVSADVAQYQPMPESFVIYQNYPNPFNPSTQINYELPVRSSVRLAIYDVVGRQVEKYAAIEEAGAHQFTWRPSGTGGIYFCRFEATPLEGEEEPYRSTIKMMFTK